MKVDVKELRINYSKLNIIIEDYLDIFNNYYNEVNFIPNYWRSVKSNYFKFITEEEKKVNKEFYHELLSLYSLYGYIIDKYSSFDGKISINEDSKDLIVNKVLENDINNIINQYESIYSSSPIVMEKINIQQNKIKNNQNNLLEYKDEVKNLYTKIKEIEEDIKNKISQIFIESINETSNENKSLGEVEDISFDMPKLEMTYDKMKNYSNKFMDNYTELNIMFEELSESYNTSNSIALEDLKNRLLTKYSVVKKNINNNLFLLKQNIDSMNHSSNIMKEIAESLITSIDG